MIRNPGFRFTVFPLITIFLIIIFVGLAFANGKIIEKALFMRAY